MKTIPMSILCILIVAFLQLPQQILAGHKKDLVSSMAMSASEKSERGEKLIKSVCKRAIYKKPCLSSLLSIPQAKNADLSGLQTIALKLVAATAVEIKIQADLILKISNTTDSSDKGIAECSKNYERAQERIESALKAVQTKEYDDVAIWVNGAMADSELCEEAFPDNKCPLKPRNTEFFKKCTTALIITNLLATNGV